jgi:rare lipoprotein A (peptidoglycan hydrolase)
VRDDALVGVLFLGLVALAATALALAVANAATGADAERRTVASVEIPEGGWYEALAAPYRVDAEAELTACGQRARETLAGLAHPVLPCGAKIVVRYADREVLTQVVDRGTGRPGRELELTTALAADLGLRGVEPVEWRFAAR